jgi:hypothetical protein
VEDGQGFKGYMTLASRHAPLSGPLFSVERIEGERKIVLVWMKGEMHRVSSVDESRVTGKSDSTTRFGTSNETHQLRAQSSISTNQPDVTVPPTAMGVDQISYGK